MFGNPLIVMAQSLQHAGAPCSAELPPFHPSPVPKLLFFSRLYLLISFGLLACGVPAASALAPQGLVATFNTAADVPVTTSSYNAAGEVEFTLGFVPQPGTNLTVVKNTGLPFITGQFSNLPNGSTVELSYNGVSYPFVAWYYGGEGNNDLMLLWPYTGMASWGDNQRGPLGDGTEINRLTPVDVLAVGALEGKTVVQVARGSAHTLALCTDGTVAAWGDNSHGQLGNNTYENSLVPVAVITSTAGSALSGKTVVAIAAGSGHSQALCSDGSVVGWGLNSSGETGVNSGSDRIKVPTEAPTWFGPFQGRSVVQIAAGTSHGLALCSDGTLASWGSNYGTLGNNTVTEKSQFPVYVNVTAGTSALAGKSVTSIAAGGSHSLALCSDGTLAAWGKNFWGQLGDNSTTTRPVPVSVNATAGTSILSGKTVVAIAAGQTGSLALCSDGTLAAWGYNGSGFVGDTTTSNHLVPAAVNMEAGTSVLAGRSVVSITCGLEACLALCSDGTLAAWGFNQQGFVGDNSTTDRLVPVAVNVDAGTSALAGRQVRMLSSGCSANRNIVIFGFVPAPEITVVGNDVEIENGDATPSADDFTDFGNVPLIPNPVSRTFNIASVGNVSLNLTGSPLVSLSGPGAAAYSVTVLPTNSVAPYGSSRFVITFDPSLPGFYNATVTVASDAVNHPTFSFGIRGAGVLNAALKQTITFSAPATVHPGLSPLSLEAYASSGLPVTLSVVSAGTTATGASISGDVLSFTGTGVVKVQATQSGDAFYAAAAPVIKTINVKADPASLTLLNLSRIYTGEPCPISTLGGLGKVMVEYKIGTTFQSEAPTNAGSYSVRATDNQGTKTGTLVVAKAPLFVTPDYKRKLVGDNNPSLTLSYSGWVNDETSSLITTAPALKTTAAKTSPGGIYPITASGGSVLANYVYIYQQGAMVVESFAGNYEALMTKVGGELTGKLNLNIVAGNTSFTAKLLCADDATGVSFKGPVEIDYESETASATILTASRGVPFELRFTASLNGRLESSVERSGVTYISSTEGRRLFILAAGKTLGYAGAHTAVFEPATPASADVPKGAGWATAAISTKGVMTLAGRLADGTIFTTSLLPDESADPVFRLFLQPYKTGSAVRLQSLFGGAFSLMPHPTLASRRYVEAATMSWVKAGSETDATYRTGFSRVNSVLMLDPWLPPVAAKGSVPAVSLGSRLGLVDGNFIVQHSSTGSPLNGTLPTEALLSTKNAVSVVTPAANATKWKTTFVPATGLFSGTFELADTGAKPRVVSFTGVLRQPAAVSDALIGSGHYLLPLTPLTEKLTGEIMFTRP